MSMWNVVKVIHTCGLHENKPLPTVLVDTGVYGYGVMMGLACRTHENGMFLVGEYIGGSVWLITDMIFPPCTSAHSTWVPSEDRDVAGTWHTHPFDRTGTLAFSPTDLGEDGIVQNYNVSVLSNGLGVVIAMVRESLKCGALIVRPARVCPYDPHLFPRLLAEQSRKTSRRITRRTTTQWNLPPTWGDQQQAAWQPQSLPDESEEGFTWVPNESEEAYIRRLGLSGNEMAQLLENGVEIRELMDWGLEKTHIEEYSLLGPD